MNQYEGLLTIKCIQHYPEDLTHQSNMTSCLIEINSTCSSQCFVGCLKEHDAVFQWMYGLICRTHFSILEHSRAPKVILLSVFVLFSSSLEDIKGECLLTTYMVSVQFF